MSRPALVTSTEKLMTETAFRLDDAGDRLAVRLAVVEVCRERGWRLLALHVRLEHVHGLVQAESATPGRVMGDWKAYASRALKLRRPGRQKFWTRGGAASSVRGSVDEVMRYILEGQGEPMETYDAGVRAS